MARAERSSSGTKYSSSSYRFPTSSMAGTIVPEINSRASIFSSMASLVIATAVLASPLRTAS